MIETGMHSKSCHFLEPGLSPCVMDVHSAMGGDRYLQLLFQKKKTSNGLQTIFFFIRVSVGKFVANVTIVNFNNFMDKSHDHVPVHVVSESENILTLRNYFLNTKLGFLFREFYFTRYVIIKNFWTFCIISSANFMSNSLQMIVVQHLKNHLEYFSTKIFLIFSIISYHQFLH